MKKIIKPLAMLIILLSVLCFLLLRKPPAPEKVEKVRIGLLPDSVSALLYIARQQGLFERHGLDVEFENYQAGAYAVNDLLANKIDVATAIEFVLVLQGFRREDLRAIGTISSSETVEVVARRDRGIAKPEDLKGKTIGSSKGTATDFFLSTFLSFHNIHPEEVRTVDVKPAEVLTALSEGAFIVLLKERERAVGGLTGAGQFCRQSVIGAATSWLSCSATGLPLSMAGPMIW